MVCLLFLLLIYLSPIYNDRLEPPRITEHPSDVFVRNNQPVTLYCKADGSPKPTIEWYKDGEKVKTGRSRSLISEDTLFFFRVIQSDSKDSDTGSYWCVARNSVGKVVSRNATLSLAFLREDFRIVPKNETVLAGESVTLECSPPRGNPEPTIAWKKDGKIINLSSLPAAATGTNNGASRYKLTSSGNLRINGVRLSDRGRYSCLATNLVGSRESTPASLSVYVKPSVKPYFIKPSENSTLKTPESQNGYFLHQEPTTLRTMTKDPIIIITGVIIVFIIPFVILLILARRHLGLKKAVGTYITIQMKKCDELEKRRDCVGGIGTSVTTCSTKKSWFPYGGTSKPFYETERLGPESSMILYQSQHNRTSSHHPDLPANKSEKPYCDRISISRQYSDDNEYYAEVEGHTLVTFGKKETQCVPNSVTTTSIEPYATTNLINTYQAIDSTPPRVGRSNSIRSAASAEYHTTQPYHKSNGLVTNVNVARNTHHNNSFGRCY